MVDRLADVSVAHGRVEIRPRDGAPALLGPGQAWRAERAAGREVFRKVVNVTSVAGTMGNPGQVNYSSGKAAVTGMTRTLAKEWGRYAVTVNCVAFGYVQTRLTKPLQCCAPGRTPTSLLDLEDEVL